MPRITAIACTGLAVAGLGLFTAAAEADAAPAGTTSWARTYTLTANQKKTYKLQLPAGYEKAPGRDAIDYTLYPASGPGFAVGKPVGTKQKPYLGARVVKSSFRGRTVSVTVKTAKLQRPVVLEIGARGTVAQVGGTTDTPARIAISGVPVGQVVTLQFDQDINYQATNQTNGIPEFDFQGQGVLVDLPRNGIIVGGSQSPLSGSITLGADDDQLSGAAQIPAGATVTIAVGSAAPVAIANGRFSVGG